MRNVRADYRSISFGIVQVYFGISSLFFYASFSSSFVSYDFDFLVRQPIKFVDELVDLAVGGFALALKAGFPFWVVRG